MCIVYPAKKLNEAFSVFLVAFYLASFLNT